MQADYVRRGSEEVSFPPKTALDTRPIGTLDSATRARLDRALRYALDIVY